MASLDDTPGWWPQETLVHLDGQAGLGVHPDGQTGHGVHPDGQAGHGGRWKVSQATVFLLSHPSPLQRTLRVAAAVRQMWMAAAWASPW